MSYTLYKLVHAGRAAQMILTGIASGATGNSQAVQMIHNEKRCTKTMQDYYFDDFNPGDMFHSSSRILTEREMIEFAGKYDPQPFHLDSSAAKASHFGALIAAGFQTAALAWALAQETGVFKTCSLAGIGIEKLRWLKPVLANDVLMCRFELLAKKASTSRPSQGIATWRFDILNQHNEIVLTMEMTNLLRRRDTT